MVSCRLFPGRDGQVLPVNQPDHDSPDSLLHDVHGAVLEGIDQRFPVGARNGLRRHGSRTASRGSKCAGEPAVGRLMSIERFSRQQERAMNDGKLTTREKFQEWFNGDLERCPIAKFLELRLVEWEGGKAVLEFDADERHANPAGTLHGGVISDIADGALGTAFASTIEDDESFTNVELKINFLRPVWKSRLRFEGMVIHRGRTSGYAECQVFDEKERLIAKANTTFLVLKGDRAANR